MLLTKAAMAYRTRSTQVKEKTNTSIIAIDSEKIATMPFKRKRLAPTCPLKKTSSWIKRNPLINITRSLTEHIKEETTPFDTNHLNKQMTKDTTYTSQLGRHLSKQD